VPGHLHAAAGYHDRERGPAVSLALLADSFRGQDRGVAFGVWGAVTGLAVAVGPLLGGVLTSGLSWRWIFFVNAPIGIAAVIIALAKVAESRAARASRPDWLGFSLFTVALSSLVYGLIESNQRSFTDGLVLGYLAVAAVLLAVFVIVELCSAQPMFDMKLFKLPTFSGGSVAAFGLSASIFSMLLYLVLYLQDILGYSPARKQVVDPGRGVPGHLHAAADRDLRRHPGHLHCGRQAYLARAG
jgi:MFS family permease